MTWPGRILVGITLVASSARAEAPRDLYDWIGVAPIVLVGTPLSDAGKLVEFHVASVLRGDVAPDSTLRVDLREANRTRSYELHPRALHLSPGSSFVLLLKPEAHRPGKGAPVFSLVRGVFGAYELPAEGADRVLSALDQFVQIQDEKDDRLVWQRMADLLGAEDPLVVRTAVGQFLKFHRGSFELLDPLRPLVDHRDDDLREGALQLLAQVLERGSSDPARDAPSLEVQLVARARRDASVAVRVAATEALGALDSRGIERVLEEIARDDPDQAVRYAAERILYQRRQERDTARQKAAERARTD